MLFVKITENQKKVVLETAYRPTLLDDVANKLQLIKNIEQAVDQHMSGGLPRKWASLQCLESGRRG